MANLVVNERIKYFATFLNNLGIAMIVTGGIAPTLAFETGTLRFDDPLRLIAAIAIWLVLGLMLVGAAQTVLLRLRG